MISEVGEAPSPLTDVLMVCRTFPFRVAGNSGPMEGETTWDEISGRVGHPVVERTTVTHKVRRVAHWDPELFRQSELLNAPTEVALTFCDYVDPALAGTRSVSQVRDSALMSEFLEVAGLTGRVRYFGTGPDSVAEVAE